MKLRKIRFGKVTQSVIALFLAVFLVATSLFGVGSSANAGKNPANDFSNTQKYRNDRLIVKLKNTAELELDQSSNFKPKNFKATGKASNLNKVLISARKQKVDKLTHQDSDSTVASTRVHQKLDNYYVVSVSPSQNIQAEVAKIAAQEGVEAAYPESKPAPAPTVNNYVSMQKYLNASPEGIGTSFAKTFPGGTGKGVRIIDLEYSWNGAHEDLTKKAIYTMVKNGTPVDPFNNTNHGTAVLGEMVATDNTVGVTGATTGIALSRVNTYNQERGWDVVGALQVAATKAVPGDVILIEQQTWAPSTVGGFAPVEWEPAIYDAIKALTDSGINVVQAAGNGGHNLDDSTVFGTTFPMGKPSSGAIIVGAGSACYAPFNSRLYFSNYGSRVELQGYGECVATTGYGDLEYGTTPNGHYTANFNGTSSAAPMVASAVASLSAAYKTLNAGSLLTPAQIRSILVSTGTPQSLTEGTLTGNIGPLPNLAKALLSTDVTAPTAPVLSATLANNKPALSWTAATDNVAVKEYHVYRNGWWLPKVTTTRTFTDTTALAKTKYKYRVYTVDASGNRSLVSNYVNITTQ